MITVLTETRHKGAVESAATALAEFSSQLLLNKDFCNLPGEWLHDVIGKLKNIENLENLKKLLTSKTEIRF